MFSNEIKPKLSFKFYCEYCDYGTSKKSNINNHYLSLKHTAAIISNDFKPKISQDHICKKCNKIYKDYSGLWRHNKKCFTIEECNKNDDTTQNIAETYSDITNETIMNILKQNSDLQQMLFEQNKTIIEMSKNNQVCSNNVTNSHNKTFNLNFFLNETCKDAMNIMDFVDSIKLQLCDFERVGEVGFVNGISDIIIKNLKQLDITERPIHCTDKKREIMYDKDENKWEKEDDTNRKVRRAIKYIANKNINLMDAYKALHPDCQKSHSIYSDSYNKFVIEALGGSGNEDCDNEDKIISRLSKVVTIEK